jgi:uncharacterized membrane protein
MSDEELKNLLKENLEVSKESLSILKSINRGRKISGLLTFLKWVIIIGVAAGAFYYLEPYLNQVKDLYGQVQNLQNSISLPR